MHFEYDPKKSLSNAIKHGIDFDEAERLWNDEDLIRFGIDYGGEKRWGIIAQYAGMKWTAICTDRGERIRIISVRRASEKEASFYDRENNDR